MLFVACTGSAFAQDLPCPDTPLYPPTRAFVEPSRPCPGEDVRLRFATCAPCWDIVDVSQGDDGITVRTEQRPDVCDPRICMPESASVALGSFAAGLHSVVVRFVTAAVRRDTANADSSLCTYTIVDTVGFTVTSTCARDTLPYVKEVVIGNSYPCPTCPPQACGGDSIPVRVRGVFPHGCLEFLGLEVVPGPETVIGPPLLRIAYGLEGCGLQPCPAVLVPWEGTAMLPPLPASGNSYWLQVEAVQREPDCVPPDSSIIGEARFPFAVVERCSTVIAHCFLTSFETDGESTLTPCDDFVAHDRPGHATFRIGSGVPIHGLEGRFLLSEHGFAVTGIEAIGAATGMRLVWQPTDYGAKYVLYSEGGAHIPAAPPLPVSEHLPILRVQVELRPTDALPPARVFLRADNLLAAGSSGEEVHGCVLPAIWPPTGFAFVFCTDDTCDFNRDGTTDVRDLVLMVNCLTDSTRCDLTRADCNGDGTFDLEDVMCCAHVLLGGAPADTAGARPDPTLTVRFGVPADDAGTIVIPVTLGGANPVAAARLVLRYPDDRFADAVVEFPGRSSWLELHEAGAGRVVVGMLDVGRAGSSFHGSFTLRLTPRSGQRPGGEVAVETAEFSDPDGVRLLADVEASVVLGGGGVALGPGQPNPFGREVRFAVTLAADGDLEVSVHDLTGRRITVLHHGPATAGSHTFRWDGSAEDGSRAPDGVYFYRARAAGQTTARKVVLLRER